LPSFSLFSLFFAHLFYLLFLLFSLLFFLSLFSLFLFHGRDPNTSIFWEPVNTKIYSDYR
jgi:hypothetical protein